MQEPSNLQVVLMGVITVFVALIVLIIMINLVSAIIRSFTKESPETAKVPVNQAPSQSASVSVTNSDKQKLVAAISVSIAEYMGTDVSHIKIQSIKRI